MSNYIELPSDAVQIPHTLNWVTPDGHMYGIETRTCKGNTLHKHYGEYFQYRTSINNHNGYVYGPVKYVNEETGKTEVRQRRIHILIAEAFVENPNNYRIVGHRNNIKSDNRASNLYWTTVQENTQKAFDDGLAKNAKGYEDSQSHPVVMFDTCTNQELARFGSVSIASASTGYDKTMISRQAKYKHPVLKPVYFRFQNDASIQPPTIVIQYDMETDEEIGRYVTRYEAARQTGISENTIWHHCHLESKPKWSKSGTYFAYSQQ